MKLFEQSKSKGKRIFLSPPHMGGDELKFVKEAFESNYIAPLGPQVDTFEKEFAEYTGIKYCVALSSGTAAMHLAFKILGVGQAPVECASLSPPVNSTGQADEVFVSTLTFIGSVTPAVFEGATPVFIDCDRNSWDMDVGLLEEELERCAGNGKLPKAVVPTDLYGQCCDLGRIVAICDRHGVAVICDSAEAMGAFFQKSEGEKTEDQISKTDLRPPTSDLWCHAGVGAKAAIYSFNGNKIITTSGGGMLASDDEGLIDHARKLSQQAREDFVHYEHSEIGYNYRMSNVLAAIGRGQLRVLNERVKRKRGVFEYYRGALGSVPGIEFMPEPEWSRSNRWLTVVLITPELFGADREQVRLVLEEENIEARPVWKPMHMQPVFQVEGFKAEGLRLKGKEGFSRKGAKAQRESKKMRYKARVVGGEVAEDLFERGLCLPSGTAMTNGDLDRVIKTILKSRAPVPSPGATGQAKAQRKAIGLFY